MQAVFGACDAVVDPEGLVQLVEFRRQGQTDVQVHFQVLQPLLQLGESRAKIKKTDSSI